MNITAEEKLMYDVMKAIYDSGIPVYFKRFDGFESLPYGGWLSVRDAAYRGHRRELVYGYASDGGADG